MAKEFREVEKEGRGFQCRRTRGKGVGQVVSARWITRHGRSDDGRQQRQDGVGHFHQTFPPSQHHGPLPVSGHVSSG